MELLEFIHTKRDILTLISVSQIHLKTFKKELNYLVKIGVLAAQQESEWVLPSFIIPKKDNRVRWISNLRELKKNH